MNFKSILGIIAFGLIGSISSAQNKIFVEIDHGGLHCPYLGPLFEQKFLALQTVDSVFLNTRSSIGELYLSSDGELTDEQITDVVVNQVGYPEPEIKAIIRYEE